MTLIKSTSDVAYWRNFWLDKADPMHRAGDEAHYDLMASELMVLIGQRPFNSVLEIGCGTGSLYKRLGFDKTSYTGVDFSPSMLSTFKQKYPDAPVFACENGATYEPAKPVDLIFSNGVIQHFALRDLDIHLGLAARSLTPGGRILHAGIPWDVMSWSFYRGLFGKGKRPVFLRAVTSYLLVRLGLRRSFGTWYSFETLNKLAARHGLSAYFFGSLALPYRFHVELTKDPYGW
jgi:SAM-dependent methyltransferase